MISEFIEKHLKIAKLKKYIAKDHTIPKVDKFLTGDYVSNTFNSS